MTVEPVVSSAIASTLGPAVFETSSAVFMAATSAFMCASCDCVAKSGSLRSRLTGYSETPHPNAPRALSTIETRTLWVPKSTPATNAMVYGRSFFVVGAWFGSPVPQYVPAEISRRRLMHGVGHGAEAAGNMVLKTVFANVVEQLPELRNLDNAGTAEGGERILGESSLAHIPANLPRAIVCRKAREAHRARFHFADHRAERVLLSHRAGDDLLIIH